MNRWATADLRPNLTILLDLPPKVGHGRFEGRDRIERQPADFHERVRRAFVELAAAEPQHYLVLDATTDRADLAAMIRARIGPLLSAVPAGGSAPSTGATVGPAPSGPSPSGPAPSGPAPSGPAGSGSGDQEQTW